MQYYTVDGQAESTFEIQRSVFICAVKGIRDFDEGIAFYKERAKKYSDATHNCYALVCRDGQQKFFDDGEPQGTAGMPILQVLKKSELTDVAAVVTRYFGGIKLGAGGLVASYTRACADAVAQAKRQTVRLCDIIETAASYSDYQKTVDAINAFGKTQRTDFFDEVKITCAVPTENTDKLIELLMELTAGKLRYKSLAQKYVGFDS